MFVMIFTTNQQIALEILENSKLNQNKAKTQTRILLGLILHESKNAEKLGKSPRIFESHAVFKRNGEKKQGQCIHKMPVRIDYTLSNKRYLQRILNNSFS
jgi:hypothetical protein